MILALQSIKLTKVIIPYHFVGQGDAWQQDHLVQQHLRMIPITKSIVMGQLILKMKK